MAIVLWVFLNVGIAMGWNNIKCEWKSLKRNESREWARDIICTYEKSLAFSPKNCYTTTVVEYDFI